MKSMLAGPFNLLSKLRQKLREFGVLATLRLAFERCRYELRRYRWRRSEAAFDRRFGTNTRYTIAEDIDFGPGGPGARLGHDPSAVATVRATLRSLDCRLEPFTFVDLGSGKGRTLLVASDHPFARIVGVEFDSSMHEIAKKNIANYRSRRQQCRRIESLCTDATVFEFPPDPLVVYLFNPFTDVILNPVIASLEASLTAHPRPVWIVYAHPKYRQALDASQHFRLARDVRGYNEYTSYAIYRGGE